MTSSIQIDTSSLTSALRPGQWDAAIGDARAARDVLRSRRGAGSEFLGWLDLPPAARASAPDISATAARIREQSDTLVVVGIGGSYLGARAVIEACRRPFDDGGLEIIHAGHHINGPYLSGLMRHLENRRFSINVISKSGTTTEPAIAFRVLREFLEARVGRDEARRRIIATTDRQRGALLSLAVAEGWETHIIPDDVGGRFSVLTPVGLLPIASAGIDIAAFADGADAMRSLVSDSMNADCPALIYAAARKAMLDAGKSVEVLAAFEPALAMTAEWWKQLYGECEGKQGRGLFPASVMNTTDLHSMGQYLQDGARILFETFLVTRNSDDDVIVPRIDSNLDGLDDLAGMTLHEINDKAFRGTEEAHRAGGAPSMTISIERTSPDALGALLYFFEYAVGISGYSLGINPFDQPGVEEYKRNMFRLLGR